MEAFFGPIHAVKLTTDQIVTMSKRIKKYISLKHYSRTGLLAVRKTLAMDPQVVRSGIMFSINKTNSILVA